MQAKKVRKQTKAMQAAETVRIKWHELTSAQALLRKARREFNLALAQMNALVGRSAR